MIVFSTCVDEIILVLPKENLPLWQKLQKKHNFSIAYHLVAGGKSRFESVKNAMRHLPDSGFVAVHDAVRPCVSRNLIERCFEVAEKENKNVVPACPMTDTIRQITPQGTKSVKREDFLQVQTPQVFSCKLLKKAYEQTFSVDFTDDASVVEALGEPIFCVDGEYTNIKITFPNDLKIAKQILTTKTI